MTEQVSKKQAVVVQGNELIVETSNSMKMNQLKILYFLMSCIEREDELFFPIEVDYKTLLAIMNYDSNKGGKKAYLTDLLEDMAQKSYYIYNKERITVFPWFGCIQIDRDIENGKALFKFNEDLSKYLLQQTRNFTQYQFGFVSTLSSSYAIKLYNLLRSFAYVGSVDFTLERLRKSLNLLNTKTGVDRYKDFKSLSKSVLSGAVEEINACTDIMVSYTPIKSTEDKRKTVGIHFEINHRATALAKGVPQVEAELVQTEAFSRPVRRVYLKKTS